MAQKPIPDATHQDAWKAQEDHEAAKFAWAIKELKKGAIPTKDEVRSVVIHKIGHEFQMVLRSHCYWKEYKIKLGLRSLIHSFEESSADFLKAEAALTAYAHSSSDFQVHVDRSVSIPAQKELIAACASLHAMRDTVRRLSKLRPDLEDAISELEKSNLVSDEASFLFDLRKNLSHGSVTVPGWSVISDEDGSRGEIRFVTAELLCFGEWNATSRAYIKKSEEHGIAPSILMRKYSKSISKFQREIEKLFYRNRREDEIDFYDLKDAYSRTSSYYWYNIFLQQVLGDRDPYDFLSMFFTYKEIRQIERFDKHSKEQIDYMISLKLSDTECPNEFREVVYKKFGVVTN